MKLPARINLLFEFVKEQHAGELRKYTNEPYHTHLWAVAEIIYSIGGNHWMICVALCHDLFENTNCTEKTLRNKLKELGFSHLGVNFICRGVNYLTDYFTKERFPTMNRALRKEKEAKRLWSIPAVFQTIKYADLIDNTKSIVKHDPKFAELYLREKLFILSGMRKGSPELLSRCDLLINKYQINYLWMLNIKPVISPEFKEFCENYSKEIAS